MFQFIRMVLTGVLASLAITGHTMDITPKEKALEGYLLSGFKSKHFGTDKKYNEENAGLGYMTLDGLFGGGYKNSLGKTSIYAGKELQSDPLKLGPVELKALLSLGGVTGYGRPITPMAVPGVGLTLGDFMLALSGIPAIKGQTPATLALQLRKKF